MSAVPSLLAAAAAILLTSLTTVASDAKSAIALDSRYNGSARVHYDSWVRGDNGNRPGWYENKKKRARNARVAVSQPPIMVLLGAGLLLVGFVAWRERRKG